MRFDLLGAGRKGLRAARRIPEDARLIEVEVRRGTQTERFSQEVLADDEDLKITLQVLGPGFRPRPIDPSTTLRPGALLVWYLFPGESYEIGAFYHRRGVFEGYYVNMIRPPIFGVDAWVVEDLYLDIWVPAGGTARLLDEEDLEAAVGRGELDSREAGEITARAAELLAAAQGGRWPPRAVRRWPAELVPALRLRRDAPGTYHAARISGRIIAYGLYLMGAVSLTSIAFAGLSDAFVAPGRAQSLWKVTLAIEAVALAPLALSGRLPATFWPRPPLVDERSLFVATLASGLAVLGLNERAEWSEVLPPVYGTLGLFSLIFAACRGWFDRELPVFALAGVAITLVALWLLL
ncbi:MAG: DUF402 domain-containing protein [Gemmatimonadetes bacterium]|nr:DUF402 domain-containing protein [Gemmatimonadota bacterium]